MENITIISDCNNPNDAGRQLIRINSLFGCHATFIAVKNEAEAAGNIIDAIDANDKANGIIIANVAPRGGRGKKFVNGSPFGYFWYKNILIVSTIDGEILSLVKKFKLAKFINVLDTEKTLKFLAKVGEIENKQINYIKNSQFRSFDFEPRVAKYLWEKRGTKNSTTSKTTLGEKKISINEIPDILPTIWWAEENFGNCKTTIFAKELNLKSGDFVKTKFGKLKYYERLKDVPNKQPAIITGSSGLGNNRFLEIVIQGASASKKLGIKSCAKIF